MTLPDDVVQEDKRLSLESDLAKEHLAEHRWHWTLNEENEGRVGFREYSRLVGVTLSIIQGYSQGFVRWRSDLAGEVGLNECIERAKMSSEKEAVTEAVAEARGQAFKTVRMQRAPEIKAVRREAQERAEEKGTTVEEEAPAIAQMVVRVEKSERERHDALIANHDLRWVEALGHISNMKRYGLQFEKLAREMHWDEEEQDLLNRTIDQVHDLLNMMKLRVSGAVGSIDWDETLNKILEEIT